MSFYKKILFAADLLPEDDGPITERVLEFTKTHNAELHIVHIIEPFASYSLNATLLEDWQKTQKAHAREILIALSKKLQVAETQIHLTIGTPKSCIVDIANEIKADLIMLGSHGRKPISNFILGSTAAGVLNHASCDVLAVRVDRPMTLEAKEERRELAGAAL